METFIIILISIALVAVVYVLGKKRRDALIADNRIVNRPYEFFKNAEIFTLTGASFERVVQGVLDADFSGAGASATKSDSRKAVNFKGPTWKAEFYKKDNDGERDVYYFHFQSWDARNGTPYGLTEMNILLTAVEKVFLAIDPAAQVKTVPIKVTSKPSFL